MVLGCSLLGMVLAGLGAHWLFVQLLAVAQQSWGAPLNWMASLGLLFVTFVVCLSLGGWVGYRWGLRWERRAGKALTPENKGE
ncbi:MAG: hypothetical protein EP343_05225 [Deltaproteobacteria bacterium]|nr:MAG: hypothetical protein EP343_05225 [Deltaproteobacteria bacterium]